MLNIPTSKNGEPLHVPLNAAALAALKLFHQRRLWPVSKSAKTRRPVGERVALVRASDREGWDCGFSVARSAALVRYQITDEVRCA